MISDDGVTSENMYVCAAEKTSLNSAVYLFVLYSPTKRHNKRHKA